ncbi:hypothetical protein [Mesorhizobium sp. A556]
MAVQGAMRPIKAYFQYQADYRSVISGTVFAAGMGWRDAPKDSPKLITTSEDLPPTLDIQQYICGPGIQSRKRCYECPHISISIVPDDGGHVNRHHSRAGRPMLS